MNPIAQIFSGNTGVKVVSSVVAVVLWVVVLGSRSVEVAKEVPLQIATPPDLVVSNDVPDKVVFRLVGPKAFLRAILDRPEEPIRVNLTGSKAGSVTYRFFSDNIHLPIGVRVMNIDPPSMDLKLEPQRTKEVPVHLELKGNLPEGFVMKRAEVAPKTVRIRGPESRVEAITDAPTIPIDLSQIRASTEFPAEFDVNRMGVQIEGASPKVAVDVAAVQANFKIRIKGTDIHVDSSYQARVDEPFITIFVRMDQDQISKLDPTQVSAEVDLRGKNKGRYTSKVTVSLPPSVGVVRVVPGLVRVTLY